MQLDLSQLRELLADIDKTNISELTLKSEDFELTVRKDLPMSNSALPPMNSVLTANISSPEGTAASVVPATRSEPSSTTATTSSTTVTPSSSASVSVDPRWVEVTSPMVGTFYSSPAPDEPVFVDNGDRVSAGQTVCIIEAMKLMNEIEAEVSGTVVEVLVENGTPVEYGQPLMRINPS
ncbi:MAG: acetyl-CoA carboxylase biotin carboxyl carrier protein [Microcoleaceae cyanobacterium]